MHDEGGSATLIFYKVGDRWWKEPILNIIAAAAQFSSYTHVEITIGKCTVRSQSALCSVVPTFVFATGEESGCNGAMANVCRVFNDNVGVVRL